MLTVALLRRQFVGKDRPVSGVRRNVVPFSFSPSNQSSLGLPEPYLKARDSLLKSDSHHS